MSSLLARYSWWRTPALAACLSTSLVSACTEPVYQGDAGDEAGPGAGEPREAGEPPACDEPSCSTVEQMDAGSDGGDDPTRDASDAEPQPPPEAGLDPVRSKWIGRYATRSFLFGYDSPLETTSRFLTLAEIKPSADGGLTLEEELCLFDGEWAFFVKGHLTALFPGTRISAALTYDEQGFSSSVAKALIGYAESANGCEGSGSTAIAQPHQVWVTGGTCDCPAMQSIPLTARDCRVSDEDRDQKPGCTFEANIGGAKYLYHAVQEERLRLVDAYRVDLDQRVYASRDFGETTNVLGCSVDGVAKRPEDCPLGKGRQCPLNTQKVELVPLTSPLTCRQVIEREGGLFRSPLPAFPASCRP